MYTHPSALRRTSRVRFDDEVLPAPPPPVANPRPNAHIEPPPLFRNPWTASQPFAAQPVPTGRTSRVPIHRMNTTTHLDLSTRDRRGSDDTLIEDDPDDKYTPQPRPSPPRGNEKPFRSALRRSITEAPGLMSVDKHFPHSHDDSHDLESGRPRMSLRHRRDSTLSTGSVVLDEDDPRVTGFEDTMKRPGKKTGPIVDHSMTDLGTRQMFILRLARALMYYGSPSHRIESQLISAARSLEIDAEFVHMPSVVICSFGYKDKKASETHFVKASGRLALGKLHNVHGVYRSVVHGQMDAKEGCSELSMLLRSQPCYGIPFRCLLAFLACFLICPMAFKGSLADALIAGIGGAILAFLQLVVACRNAMYADVFEISIAIMVSFAARALSAIPGHIFCYQAISSSAVVLILPGYFILCSSLELASKNMLAGSVRMVYAIIYSLFLGFGLTIGSDFAYLAFPDLRAQQAAAHNITTISLHGNFTADNSTAATAAMSTFTGSFSFANVSHLIREANPDDLLEICPRSPHSLFLLQAFPYWTLFLLVPAYSFISSLWNLQPLKSRQLPVMVAISCASFAANKAANHYIFNRSDVVSAIGAFVVGLLGNIYSRACGGTAFQVMSVAVCFLIPSGIAATGGLSQNYTGHNGDSYSAGLSIGLRMVQVGIGITVGLFGSGLFVYSFGPRKKNALFAF